MTSKAEPTPQPDPTRSQPKTLKVRSRTKCGQAPELESELDTCERRGKQHNRRAMKVKSKVRAGANAGAEGEVGLDHRSRQHNRRLVKVRGQRA